jgi:alpha-tubulin suppressor-like RCC1 family protein
MANNIESLPVYYDQSIAGQIAYKDYRQKVAMTRDITGAIARNTDRSIAANAFFTESINARIVDAQIATTTAMYNNTQEMIGALGAGFSDVSREIGEMNATMSMGFAALNSAVQKSAQNICDRLDTMNDILNNPSLTKTRELYRRASTSYDKGFYEEAKNDLLEALASNKIDYISWFLLGKTCLFGASEFSSVIDLDAAVDALKNAVKYITPDARKQEEARALAAEMCFFLGLAQQTRAMDALHAHNEADCRSYLEQAGASYSQSWDYSAQMLEARYNRARCKALLGATPGAIADLEAVVLADRNYCIKVCADNDFAGIVADFAALIKKLKNAAFISAQKDYDRLKALLAELAALGGTTKVTAPAFTEEISYFDVLDYAEDFKRNIPILEKAIADTKEAKEQAEQKARVAKERERIAKYQVCISAEDYHTVGLKAGGTVVAVGENKDGQCNVSDWRGIVAVAVGVGYTVGLGAVGMVVAVGSNYKGPCNVSSWCDIVAVAAGAKHTVGLKKNGTVVAVGSNDDVRGNYKGQCNVDGWRDMVAVAAGSYYTVGLKAGGTVVAVGDNSYGQCDVSGWRDMVAIAAGNSHTVGLKADGTVVAAGTNSKGRYKISGWRDMVAVAAGYEHTVGLKADGTVVAVGDNEKGQCNVSGWYGIAAVSARGSNTVGLKADGTVVAVGLNDKGQCDVSGWRDIGPIQELAKEKTEREAKEKVERDAKLNMFVAKEAKARAEQAEREAREKPERETREEAARKAKAIAEQDAREAATVAYWKAQGLCAYCGGKLALFTRKCKTCGKEKNY